MPRSNVQWYVSQQPKEQAPETSSHRTKASPELGGGGGANKRQKRDMNIKMLLKEVNYSQASWKHEFLEA